MTISASDILSVTKSVTKEWTKQRKSEESGRRSRSSREYVYSDRVCNTHVTNIVLPDAYDHASGGGKYTVSKRQLFYACRDRFKELTDRELKYNYFAQTLLVQYLNRHPELDWKITADARGTLTVPNAHYDVRVPCGTLQIAEHLQEAADPIDPMDFDDIRPAEEWPSLRQGERYQAVLYIEKEGFEPLLEETRIAERFDLAILTCKGQSVAAARRYVDEVCNTLDGVPLFIVHDFDKYGFEIAQCLTRVSDWAQATDRVAYQFENEISFVDFGLRLADVEKYGLAAEKCKFKSKWSLPDSLTAAEKEFLRGRQRVELNAFTSPQFIEWLRSKLIAHGLGKRLIPDDDVLADAYRRQLVVAKINSVVDHAIGNAVRTAKSTGIPKSLRRQLKTAMKEHPDEAWDKTLYRLVRGKLGEVDDD